MSRLITYHFFTIPKYSRAPQTFFSVAVNRYTYAIVHELFYPHNTPHKHIESKKKIPPPDLLPKNTSFLNAVF